MTTQYWDLATHEELDEGDLQDRYADSLNEVYGPVKMGSFEWDAADVLSEMDPIAYRVGFSDWLDSELGETITDEQPFDVDALSEQMSDLGAERGRAAGSWVLDGNTDVAVAEALIAGYEAGDPAVMDSYEPPSPLSGEFADSPTIGDVLGAVGVPEDHDIADDLLDAYENGFSEGYWAEVLRSAKAMVA